MDNLALSPEQEHFLRSQVIDATHPGPVLHDFQVLLDFIGPQGVPAAGKYNLLPIDAIGPLDQRLSRPLRLDLKRPQLRSHPYLQGLHLLLRATGLGRVEGTGDDARLVLDPDLLEQWNRLNPTERYFTLLEAWLRIGRPEMVGDRDRRVFGGFLDDCVSTWYRTPAGGTQFDTRRPQWVSVFGISRSFYLLALMDLFGLMEVEQPRSPVQPWCPAGVKHVPFGDALFTPLARRTFLGWDTTAEEDEEDDDEDEDEAGEVHLGHWQALFQPYFPAWQNNLVISTAKPRKGVFIFRVSLGKVWRRIAMPARATLEDLARWILDSVDFDDDHLYEFIYRSRLGTEVRSGHPFCEEGPVTTEVRLGELPLQPGQVMRFVFDFGDNWQFDVKLESIEPSGKKIKAPCILEQKGKAPQQYGDW
jgi:hypothetical protein